MLCWIIPDRFCGKLQEGKLCYFWRLGFWMIRKEKNHEAWQCAVFVILIVTLTQCSSIFGAVKETRLGETISLHAVPDSTHLQFSLSRKKLGKWLNKPDMQNVSHVAVWCGKWLSLELYMLYRLLNPPKQLKSQESRRLSLLCLPPSAVEHKPLPDTQAEQNT